MSRISKGVGALDEGVRNRHMKLRVVFLVAAMILANTGFAAAAPAGLLGKTIHVSYGSFTPGRTADGRTDDRSPPRTHSITIYISSAGRIFFKAAVRAGHFGRNIEAAPERTAHGIRFAGSTLIGVHTVGNHASQLKVSFDRTFQTCSAEVIIGSVSGAPLRWVGLNGERYTATGHPNVSNVSCSVENGNAFAN